MSPSRINALIASAYNLHVGPTVRGEAMTPARAATLPRAERIALCELLRVKGGSEIYTQGNAAQAVAVLSAEVL